MIRRKLRGQYRGWLDGKDHGLKGTCVSLSLNSHDPDISGQEGRSAPVSRCTDNGNELAVPLRNLFYVL